MGAEHGDAAEGRRALLADAGIDPATTVVAGQVHGARVAIVSARDAGEGAFARGQAIRETDGLATAEPGVGLLVTSADCPGVVLYDPAARCLAVVHSGWRGTAARIAQRGIETLVERLGASRDRLRAGIGPGIGPCCYAVGDDVSECVPAPLRDRVLARGRLDLHGWIGAQLAEAGISSDRVERLDACTACRTDLFFSHRAERGRCGRFGVVAALAS